MSKPPKTKKNSHFVLFCDGASRGNPGPGAYGFVILENDVVIKEEGGRLGIVTNNVAEYQGLIHGLQELIKLKAKKAIIKSDSQLLVRQLEGKYQVKAPQIKKFYDHAKTLLLALDQVEFFHIPREENSRADALCNEALDNEGM